MSPDTVDASVAPTPLTVRLEGFEGPLDLLLHLARSNEIDLARLPIRQVTDRYLAYLESVEFRDLDDAGGFLVLAATLIYLKSKLLLPTPEVEEEVLDPEGEALRLELEARLRAYARVKEIGEWLRAQEVE
jgi:segregation and condensation protein A